MTLFPLFLEESALGSLGGEEGGEQSGETDSLDVPRLFTETTVVFRRSCRDQSGGVGVRK